MRILEITSELDGGGVDRLLYDYCSRMAKDIQFDFVVTSKTEGILEQPLKDLGCNIYRIAQIREGLSKHSKELQQILMANKYDVIHDHSGFKAWCNLRVAKKCGVPVRIAHSHQAFMFESSKQKMLRNLSVPITKYYATELFACGCDAAEWMWGNSLNNVYIMKNAIDAAGFNFSAETRNKVREDLGIADKFVIGNVSRFSYQKNHEFLIQIFAEIRKINTNAVLMLVGRGELEAEVRKQVEDLKLSDSVLFFGVRNDVPDLLNAMDVFLLPSRFEGLPVTLVEVQANGLSAVVSENITKEVARSDDINYISLSSSADEWAKVVVEQKRHDSKNLIKNSDYDLDIATEILKSKYLSFI